MVPVVALLKRFHCIIPSCYDFLFKEGLSHLLNCILVFTVYCGFMFLFNLLDATCLWYSPPWQYEHGCTYVRPVGFVWSVMCLGVPTLACATGVST